MYQNGNFLQNVYKLFIFANKSTIKVKVTYKIIFYVISFHNFIYVLINSKFVKALFR